MPWSTYLLDRCPGLHISILTGGKGGTTRLGLGMRPLIFERRDVENKSRTPQVTQQRTTSGDTPISSSGHRDTTLKPRKKGVRGEYIPTASNRNRKPRRNHYPNLRTATLLEQGQSNTLLSQRLD